MTSKLAADLASHADETITAIPVATDSALAVIPPSTLATVEEPESMSTGNYTTDVRSLINVSDIQMPFLRIAQGLSKEVQEGKARPGQLTLLGHDPVNAADVVILSMAKKRTLRSTEDNGKTILCSSPDSIVGTGTPGGVCADCPLAEFTKGKPPACTFAYSYRAYSLTHNQLIILELQKTSLRAAKDINYFLAQDGARNSVVTLGTQQQKGEKGTYSVPVVSRRKLTDEEIEQVEMGIPF